RDLLDYWNWWKTRRSEIGAVILLAGVLLWMSVEVWQAERSYRGGLLELRRSYSKQEENRERQFSRSIGVLDSHLSRLNVETAEQRKQQGLIREMMNRATPGPGIGNPIVSERPMARR
ncbi:MAG TPA: hypothetical protein VJY33_00180, partial [Isosphaeraceae bacterium]|nr:hypothetical protein [Isosphaeraceae bacterium]